MNKELFLQLIENNCDCKQDCLDTAINRGLQKAKNDRVDTKKILTLAVAFVLTFSMCFTVNTRPLKMAVDGYYVNWNKTMSGNIEILNDYLVEMTSNIKKHLGGK
ncbi:MAG: hypothetical protein LBG94_04505 [Treponema sp.]|jgi:hypothetical protein|nr:hypothetical protein [Treponema sp.]